MNYTRCKRLALAAACMLALYQYQMPVLAQSSDASPGSAPYEIPLSIYGIPSRVVDANPTNPYWVPVSPANPYPDQNYQFERLYITLGINGGTPESLIFDTGSTAFNIDAGPDYRNDSWLPLAPGASVSVGDPLFYGDGSYGNQTAQTTVSSVQFYQLNNNLDNVASPNPVAGFAPSQGIPISLNVQQFATGQSLGPDGTPGQIVGEFLGPSFGGVTVALYQHFLALSSNPAYVAYWNLLYPGLVYALQHPTPMYQDLGWLQSVQAGNPGGIVGAGPFSGGAGQLSIFGEMTSTGYVVAANSQPGALTASPQNCGSCAHVIMNLNPAIRAQFNSVVPWYGGASGVFPTSGAPVQANQFGEQFTYVINHSGTAVMLPTLLDSGTPQMGTLSDDGTLAAQTSAGNIDPNAQPLASGNGNAQGNVVANTQLTMAGVAPGALPTTMTTVSPYYGNAAQMLQIAPGDGSPNALIGFQFFMVNSVMYDLQNESTGYTPFFVSIDPISTNQGYSITSAMAPQGIAGIISGNGSLTVGTGGSAQLSNANTYTGATHIDQGGWLGLAGPGSIATSSGVQADGVFDISRTAGPALIQSLSGNGNVALGANTLELTNAHGMFNGVLADGGLGGGAGGSLIVANGLETLTGINTFTGNTGIGPRGGLVLNGALAGSVQNAGVLAGQGHIGGNLAVTGTVAPGNGTGSYQTLTVGGTYHQQAGSTYLAQLNPLHPDMASQIAVNGAALLDPGARVDVMAPSELGQPYTVDSRYTVLSAGQGLTGTYTLTGETVLSPVLGLDAAYDTQHAYLDVVQTRSLNDLAGTRNQRATLAWVQDLDPPENPLFMAVTNLSTEGQMRAAADLLSGELHASMQNTFLEDSRYLRDAVTSRLRQATQDGPVAQTGPAVQTQPNGLTWWGQFVGSWSHVDSDGNAAALASTVGGFVLGADVPVSIGEHGRVGLASGYTQTSFDVDQRDAYGSSHDGSLSAYAGTQWGGFDLSLGAGYTQHLITTTRTMDLPDFSARALANEKASTAQVFSEVGYPFQFKAATLEPFVQAAYVRLKTDGFQESGGAAGLSANGQDRAVTYTTLGAHAATSFPFNGDLLTAHATLGWQHAFDDTNPATEMVFSGGGYSFTVDGLPIARNALAVDVGLDLPVGKHASFDLSYNGQIARHAVDSGFRDSFIWRF